MIQTTADTSSCFSRSLRSELRQLAGAASTSQAQVHLHRLITTSTEVSLVIELIAFLIYIGNFKCQVFSSDSFVLRAASTQTKDCLHLLKLLGVPVIQVRPAKHRIYICIHISLAVSFLSSLTSCIFISLLFLFCLVLQAPGDAEALCAQLVRQGTVDAVASEDMDTLPFGANILIRQLNAKRDR